MKLRNLVFVLAAAASVAAQTSDGGITLQRAIRKETVEGDLKGAIELYKKVVAGAARDRAAAAKALLRLGECYEKQGNAEAQRAYQRLVSEFSDQKDQARDAQIRLAALGATAGGNKTMSAQLIAKGVTFQRGSRVTPDGRSYVFADPETGDLAVRDLETGAVRRLTNQAGRGPYGTYGAREPVLSRDGKHIAYHWVQDSPGGLRVINVDGSSMRIVPFKEDGYILPLDWSPDQKSILVGGRFQETASGTGSFWSGLATVDLGTGAVKRLGATRSYGSAGFSPDGRWVVFSKQRTFNDPDSDIFTVDTQTGQETAVVTGTGRDRNPMWVPNSDRVVFQSDRNGRNAIWMVRLQDGKTAGAPVLVKPDAGDFSPLGIGNDGSLFYGVQHVSSDVYQATVDPQTLRAQGSPARLVET